MDCCRRCNSSDRKRRNMKISAPIAIREAPHEEEFTYAECGPRFLDTNGTHNGSGYRTTGGSSLGDSMRYKFVSVLTTADPSVMGEEREIELQLISERIMTMVFPDDGSDLSYKRSLKDVSQMLERQYQDNYQIINLSERRIDLVKLNPRVLEFGIPAHVVNSVSSLLAGCRQTLQWLSANSHHVTVFHCKGDLGRLSTFVAAYMFFCASNARGNEAVLSDKKALKELYDGKLSINCGPSHRRYLQYFTAVLSGSITLAEKSINLHAVTLGGLSKFFNGQSKAGGRFFLKVYKNMSLSHTSPVYTVNSPMEKIRFPIDPALPLKGDILIKCFYKRTQTSSRETLFSIQFNTSAVQTDKIYFYKQELDVACSNAKFPNSGRVDLLFKENQGLVKEFEKSVAGGRLGIDRTQDPLIRWDSHEDFHNFDAGSSIDYIDSSGRVHGPMNQQHSSRLGAIQHTAGPVDGSPYAEIVRDTTITTSAPRVSGTRHSSPGANHWQVSSHDSGFSSSTPGSAKPRPQGPLSSSGTGSSMPNTSGSAVGLSASDARELDRLLEELRVAGETAVTSVKRSQSTRSSAAPGPSTNIFPTSTPLDRAPTSAASLSSRSTIGAAVGDGLRSTANPQPSFRTSLTRVHQELPSSTPAVPARPLGSSLPSAVQRDLLGYESEPEGPSSYFRRTAAFGESPTERELRLLEELKSAQEELLSLRRQQQQQMAAAGAAGMGRGRTSSGDEVFDINLRYSAVQHPHQQQQQPADLAARRRHHSQQDGGYFDEPRYRPRVRSASVEPQPFPVEYHFSDIQRHGSRPHDMNFLHRAQLYDRSFDLADAGDTKLAELERSLQAASDKIYRDRFSSSYSAHRENQKQQMMTQTHHQMITKKDEVPGEIYEEIETVTLQPIGKGVHDLESAHHGIGRTLSGVQAPRYNYFSHRADNVTARYGATLPRQRPSAASVHLSGSAQHRTNSTTGTMTRLINSSAAQFGTIRPGQHRLVLASGAAPGHHQTLTAGGRGKEGTRANVTQSMDRIHQMGGHQVWSGINNVEPIFRVQHRDEQRAKTPQPRSTGVVSSTSRRRHMSHEYVSATDAIPSFEITPPSDASAAGFHHSSTTIGQKIPVHTVPISVNTNTSSGYHYQAQTSPPTQHQQQQQQQSQFASSKSHQIHVRQMQYEPQQHTPPQQHQQQQQAQQQLQLQQQQQAQQQLQLQQQQQAQQQLQLQQLQQSLQNQQTTTTTTTLLNHQYPQQQTTLTQTALGSAANMPWSPVDGTNDSGVNTPKFVRDTSKYWYKPSISREEAISLLRDKPPGSFVVRDSNSFPNAFGLAVKVAHLPQGVTPKSDDVDSELVRHFLIEPTAKGVRLKGCSNEPVFGSLTALIYQHTLTALALPCRLVIPPSIDGQSTVVDGGTILRSPAMSVGGSDTWQVLFLGTVEVESMTGSNAVVRSIDTLLDEYHPGRQTTECQLKLSQDGVTLTDTQRKLFFRRHYQPVAISFCGIDPKGRSWSGPEVKSRGLQSGTIFGLITRKQSSQAVTATDNVCHVLSELQHGQSSISIVNAINRYLHR